MASGSSITVAVPLKIRLTTKGCRFDEGSGIVEKQLSNGFILLLCLEIEEIEITFIGGTPVSNCMSRSSWKGED
jgi:hypothetical protein